ncbi:hypothetical protein HOF78_00515 [Candidatus Woesearchaeota archaeon]|jgi:hypothetical protein|nr:hypothetical protein [Candidatus Woesearchaeota archaeon]MBT6044551.1 hypothetical protein [Candidatus Woesearchaeota archaeon]
MGKVRIKKNCISKVPILLDIIAFLMGILVVLILAFSGGAMKYWRYNAFKGLYGSIAPLALVLFVVILIVIYLKINEN